MKYFICSDIHSFFNEWMSTLNKNNFDINNPEHIIVVAGDLLDRGPGAIDCINFIDKLPDQRKILITGNHEDLIQQVFNRGYFLYHDYSNGTVDTCVQLSGLDKSAKVDAIILKASENKQLQKYLKSTRNYYELSNYIIVHGWIPCHFFECCGQYYDLEYLNDWRNATTRKWMDARWINGMEAWHAGVVEPNKTIICGHWHCSFGNANYHNDGIEFLDDQKEDRINGIYENFEPFEDSGIIALDACTAYSGQINCKVLEIN